MANPVPPPAHILETMFDMHKRGYSTRAIAKEIGVSHSSVSRHLSRLGADTDRSQTAEATAARVRILQGRRIDLAEKLFEDAISMRERVWDSYEMVGNSPEGPVRTTLDEPPLKEQSDGVKSIESLISTVDKLMEGAASNNDVEDAKNVLMTIANGLAKAVQGDTGLGELDRDHDYDIREDPDQQVPEL